MSTRLVATEVIASLINNQGSLRSLMANTQMQVEDTERALLQQLCYGTARNFPKLYTLADALLDRPIRKLDPDVLALIMVGLYQLSETRIPDHAAISETVDAAHDLGLRRVSGLVNAVLRRFTREQEHVLDTLEAQPSFQFNHPEWFIGKLKHNWPDHWESILAQNNLQPPMCIRVNTQRVSRETYIGMLESENINALPGAFSDVAIYLTEAVPVTNLPGFMEGLFSVQDEAAQLSCQLVDPQPEERILDACAAPGGKLCHLLEHQPKAIIQALELDQRRAARITENLTRLKLDAALKVGDAAEQNWWDGSLYDKILLDAPCSATGVIRRNPDIKMLRQGEDIHTQAKLQMRILENLWTMLKPGGTLVYATCSIFSQENERIIERFVAEHDDASEIPVDAPWGVARPFGRQLFPQENGHDGFYYAKLVKKKAVLG